MAQWVHKATRARATYADAHDLVVIDHFLCKSIFAHGPASQGAREIEMVAGVAVGDVIHYYFRTPEGRIRSFGSFRVVDASTFPSAFEACPGQSAAVQVREIEQNRQMLGRLRRSHWHDPKLGAFTGWAVEKLPVDSGTPGFDQAKMFPSLTTSLWHFPDPSLPRVRASGDASAVR